MLEIITAALYIGYTILVCFIIARLAKWWAKVLLTLAGVSALSLLPALSLQLASLISSLLSLGISIGVYVLLFIIFIRCMFPHHRRWF